MKKSEACITDAERLWLDDKRMGLQSSFYTPKLWPPNCFAITIITLHMKRISSSFFGVVWSLDVINFIFPRLATDPNLKMLLRQSIRAPHDLTCCSRSVDTGTWNLVHSRPSTRVTRLERPDRLFNQTFHISLTHRFFKGNASAVVYVGPHLRKRGGSKSFFFSRLRRNLRRDVKRLNEDIVRNNSHFQKKGNDSLRLSKGPDCWPDKRNATTGEPRVYSNDKRYKWLTDVALFCTSVRCIPR